MKFLKCSFEIMRFIIIASVTMVAFTVAAIPVCALIGLFFFQNPFKLFLEIAEELTILELYNPKTWATTTAQLKRRVYSE